MKKLLFLFFVVVSIPILVINFFYSYSSKKIVTGIVEKEVNSPNKEIYIRVLNSDNTVTNMNIEDYLVGVVSAEVPLYFEDEALKAQAVASRTYALKQMENNKDKNYDVTTDTLSQVYLSNEELKNKWGSNYNEYFNKIKNVVDSTKGEYVSYDDDYIYAFFFSTSNGYTEDNKNVFGMDLPYLKSVDSSFDKEESDNFNNEVYLPKEEFYRKLDIPYSDTLTINGESRSESNRLLYIEINGYSFKGRELQSLLGLKSNDITISENIDYIKLITNGYGHGVGMSQYGANALAKQNKTYQEILKYYYTGTEIKKL